MRDRMLSRGAALGLALALAACEQSMPAPPDTDFQVRPLEDPITAVERQTTFTCNPAGMGAEPVVWRSDDGDARLVLEAAGGPCNYHVFYESGGARQQLSDSPSGYLLTVAAARPGPGGDVVACITDIDHAPSGGSQHEIDGVSLACAWRLDGAWTTLTRLVSPDDWAPWPREITLHPDDTITVRYVHDFTFQFMNLSNDGRPPEDGLYELRYDLRAAAELSDEQVSPDVVSRGDEMQDFVPTEDERADFDDVVRRRFHNAALPEDADLDGDVDAADVDVVMRHLGASDGEIDVGRYRPDVDADGDVDAADVERVRDAL